MKHSRRKSERRNASVVFCRRVRVVAAAAPDERERAAIRRGQLTSDLADAHQNRQIDSAGVTEGDRVRPHRPAKKKKSKKVTKALNITRIGSVAHRVQRQPRAEMKVAQVGRLARDEQP
jgi:hypothetical protein